MDNYISFIEDYKKSTIKKLEKEVIKLDKKLTKYKLKIIEAEKEITIIKNSGIDYCYDDNNGCALTSTEDRIRILENMKTDLGIISKKNFNIGLFHHVDNIRNIYAENNMKCPEWFVEKYGKLLLLKKSDP